tara:strand:+ start:56 stop:775 length:720 start_codon:yes stop_codon:yes gene_type:complete
MNKYLDQLETLLCEKKLSGTVSLGLPSCPNIQAKTGLKILDKHLNGGFPRGHLSEIIGPKSSGRSSIMCAALAAATKRGEIVALIDAVDSFDPVSGQAAGIELNRMLWVRGQDISHLHAERMIERAIKSAELVCRAGQFGLVVVDVADALPIELRRVPSRAWMRLARAIEASKTVGLLVGPVSMRRSSTGFSVVLTPTKQFFRWSATDTQRNLFKGLEFDVEVVSTRQPVTVFRVRTEC